MEQVVGQKLGLAPVSRELFHRWGTETAGEEAFDEGSESLVNPQEDRHILARLIEAGEGADSTKVGGIEGEASGQVELVGKFLEPRDNFW